jgi:alpha-glucosidase
MLGLPGGAYIYQGEELGLPEHTTIGDAYREDPTFFRTKGDRVGRDGCRVPLPWEGGVNESNGFSATGKTWLPHPASYANYARDKQESLGAGNFRWAPEFQDENTLAYVNNGILVLTNFGREGIVLPAGELLVTTQHDLRVDGELEIDQTVWIKL